jgi:UDP-glucuronate decarboxylase
MRGDNITVFGDGSQTRSFSYVTDTISASLLFMGLDRSSETVLNIGMKEENRIRDLAERIKNMAVSDSTIRFLPLPAGDHLRRLPDTARMERLLGWTPSVRLETGLERTLRWFRSKRLHPS